MKKMISGYPPKRFHGIVSIAILILGIASFFSYLWFDDCVISWVSSNQRELDGFSGETFIRALGKVYVPLWLLFLWAYLKNRPQLVLAGSLSILLALAIVGPAKIIMHRSRPREVIKQVQILREEQGNKVSVPPRSSLRETAKEKTCDLHTVFRARYQSFPSGDTATIFAPTTAAVPFGTGLCLSLLYILSCLVGSLAVASLSHYPSDVFIGAAVGLFCGRLALYISRQWISQNVFHITEWWRNIVLAGLILIPVLSAFSGGMNGLSTFVSSSAVLTGCVYITLKVPALCRHVYKKLRHEEWNENETK